MELLCGAHFRIYFSFLPGDRSQPGLKPHSTTHITSTACAATVPCCLPTCNTGKVRDALLVRGPFFLIWARELDFSQREISGKTVQPTLPSPDLCQDGKVDFFQSCTVTNVTRNVRGNGRDRSKLIAEMGPMSGKCHG